MRRILVVMLIPLLLASCGESAKERQLRLQKDSIQAVANQGAQDLQKYLDAFNEIQENLDKIKQQESIITVNTTGNVEDAQNKKDQINEDILTIYKLMLENKEKLARLQRSIRNSKHKNSSLQKMVTRMQKQMEEKDAQIYQLKTKLEQMDLTVEGLNKEIANMSADIDTFRKVTEHQTEVIQKQTQELNTAFYIVGTKKELKEYQILTKEGGFIGIGGVQKLQADFSKDHFKKINITRLKSIPLLTKKAVLVSSHPSSSFNMVKSNDRVDSLVITNPKKFWSMSKYLVIMVN